MAGESSTEDSLARLIAVAEEQLRWQRATALPQIRLTVEQALTTTQMRRAYELCDGSRSGGDIGSAVGTTQQTISNWSRRWRDIGIAYETGDRHIHHLVSLDALGLPIDVGDDPRGGGRPGRR